MNIINPKQNYVNARRNKTGFVLGLWTFPGVAIESRFDDGESKNSSFPDDIVSWYFEELIVPSLDEESFEG
jgi:hypothetical protein